MSFLRANVAEVLRFFRRDASIAIPAVAILALGLGANIAIFAVAYAVLLRPLAVTNQESLVVMWERAPAQSVSVWEVSYRDFGDWESSNATFTGLAATGSVNWSARLMRKEGPVVVLPFAAVSGSFFDLLGTLPSLGRGLTRSDDRRSSPGVAVLSDSTWRNHFGSDPSVIGRTAMIDDGAGLSAKTIIGVMPPEFDYPRGAELWLPIAPTLGRLSTRAGFDMLEERGLGILYVAGRLKPGTSLQEAIADMDAIVGRLTTAGKPGTGRSIVVTSLVDHIFGPTRPALLLLIGAATLVLLLTCANVVGLLLARLSANRRDLSIRMALGATRWHLARQAFAEGAGLVAAGMTAAILLALWSVPVLTALAPETVPRLDSVTLRAPALLGFSVSIGLISALACAVLPLLIARPRARGILAGRPETMSRAATLGARSGLVMVQTAIAVVLLTAATLTVRSFQGIQQVEIGFDPDRLVTFDVLAPPGKYEDRAANERFYRLALERVRQLPSVSAAAAIHLRPFEFGPIGSGAAIILDGQSPRDREAWRKHPSLNAEAISPDYFKVMGIPVLQGRAFTEQDSDGSPRVVIVSLSAARRLWPGQNPIGKRLMASYDQPPGDWQTVVGVAGDVRYRGLTEGTFDLYKPYRQSEDAVKHFIVKTSQDPSFLMERLRSEIGSVEPEAAVDAIRPMRDVVDRQMDPWRFAALLFSLLALLALIVAVVGLYALLAHQVEDRGREIGIRMALGAAPVQIFRMFGARVLTLLAAGLLAGVVTAVLAAHSMEAVLYGVTPVDARSHAIAGLLLLIAAAAGAFRPLRRATAIDPVVALRQD